MAPPLNPQPAKSATASRPKRARKMTDRALAFVTEVHTASALNADLPANPPLLQPSTSVAQLFPATQPSTQGAQLLAGQQPSTTAQLLAGQQTSRTAQLLAGQQTTMPAAQLLAGLAPHTTAPAHLHAGTTSQTSTPSQPPAQPLAGTPPSTSVQPAAGPSPSMLPTTNAQPLAGISSPTGMPLTGVVNTGDKMDLMMAQLSSLQNMLLAQQQQIDGLKSANQQTPARPVSTTATGESHSMLSLSGMGEQDGASPRPLLTAGMPLGHSLPVKIKQDIWDGAYVDLAALLYPDTHTTYGVQLTGDTSEGSGVGQLSLTQHKKKIHSIGDWTKAFSTFISVYIQKPGWEKDATDLLTYMHEVQSIAEHGLDWASYDEMYRRTLDPQIKSLMLYRLS